MKLPKLFPAARRLNRDVPQGSTIRVRSWTPRLRLGALLVPLLAVALLALGEYRAAAGDLSRAKSSSSRIMAGNDLAEVALAIQDERLQTAVHLAAGSDSDAGNVSLATIRAQTDQRLHAITSNDRTFGPAGRWQAIDEQIRQIVRQRPNIDARHLTLDSATAGYDLAAQAALDLADSLLRPDDLADRLPALATRLDELLNVSERFTALQTTVGIALSRPTPLPEDFTAAALGLHLQDTALREFRLDTSPAGSPPLTDAALAPTSEIAKSLASGAGNAVLPSYAAWQAAVPTALEPIHLAVDTAVDDLAKRASEAVDQAKAGLIRTTALLFVAVLVTVYLPLRAFRSFTRRTRTLRERTQAVCDAGFGEALLDEAGRTEARLNDEPATQASDDLEQIGQLVEKLRNDVLQQAREQREMRRGHIDVLVNLSRRCQSLVGNQLSIIERWEHQTSDPEELQRLFKLDHLATRMRRINDNLVLLSGGQAQSVHTKPTPVSEVFQAGISAIEQYQRVAVRNLPTVKIKGGLVKDLVRILAELIDNATSFSPPDTRVVVTCRLLEDGSLSVSVLDSGIGMTDDLAAEANSRLLQVGSIDLIGEKRLGLFVVGRLAGRHNLAVKLNAGTALVGVRAMIRIPASCLVDVDIPDEGRGNQNVSPWANIRERYEPPSSAAAPSRLSELPSSDAVTPLPAARERRATPARLFTGSPPAAETETTNGQPSPFFRRNRPVRSGEGVPATSDVVTWSDEHEREPGWFRSTPALGARSLPEDESKEKKTKKRRAKVWASVADDAWKVVDTVTHLEPESYDENGLPQRRRGEHLMPGGIEDPESLTLDAPVQPKNPARVRDRITAFQRGLSGQRRPSQPTASAWTMLSDNGWHRAIEVAKQTPTTFTEDGLPQRVRGANLLPGSARTTLPLSPSARSPENVASRVGSFRDGVRKARTEAGS